VQKQGFPLPIKAVRRMWVSVSPVVQSRGFKNTNSLFNLHLCSESDAVMKDAGAHVAHDE